MIQDELLSAQVGLFSALADPTRLQILELLHQKGPMHVTKIYEALGKPQNLVSHHLNCLRTCGLAEMEKQGRMAIYRVANPEIDRILDWAHKQVIVQAERSYLAAWWGRKDTLENDPEKNMAKSEVFLKLYSLRRI